MADAKRVPASGTGLDAISGLLELVGTQNKTTGTAKTGPLEELLRTLMAPQDGTAQLESIFQQAAGQIPKFSAAFANAVGARTGGNSAVQAALSDLLSQTTLAGQKQLAEQDLQRQQVAANAAGNLAQATRGTTTSTNPNYGNAGKLLGGLQIAGKLGLTDKIKENLLGGKLTDVAGGAGPDLSGTIFSPNFSFSTDSALSNLGSSIADSGPSIFSSGLDFSPVFSDGFFDFASNAASSIAPDIASQVGSSFGDSFGDSFSGFFSDLGKGIAGIFGFEDGGLVGRDGAPVREPQEYAEGGLVRAGGGRRSSAPSYDPLIRPTTAANNSVVPGLNPARSVPSLSIQLPDRDYEDAGGIGESTSTATQASPEAVAAIGLGMQGLQGLAIGMALSPVLGPVSAALSQNLGIPGMALGMLGKSAVVNALQAAINGSTSAAPSGLGDVGEGDEGNTPSIGDPSNDNPDSAPSGSVSIGQGANDDGSSNGGTSGGSGADGNGPGGTGSGPGNGPGGNAAWKDGGKVKGPGTGTSDSIHAMLSNGEYVVSDDVVDAVGVEFFDRLQAMFHKTAGGQNG